MEAVVDVSDVTKVYAQRAVVDAVTWKLAPGSACALLGANGAGKTTLLRMVLGFSKPSRGTCTTLGVDAWDMPADVRQRIAYVADQLVLPAWMRVNDLIQFHGSLYPQWDLVRLASLRDLFAIPSRSRVASLSKGEHRRLMILLAVCQNADLMILDEPASGLDVEIRREFLGILSDYLSQGARSIVFSTHLLTDVERVADQVLLLQRGRVIADGTLDGLLDDVKVVTISRGLFERTRERWERFGILATQDRGETVSFTTRKFGADGESFVATLPASSVDVSSVPFEDVYLALTRATPEPTPC